VVFASTHKGEEEKIIHAWGRSIVRAFNGLNIVLFCQLVNFIKSFRMPWNDKH
jgi:hypothetical protein